MTNKKELLFEVNDYKVYKDSTYVVRDKEDLDAPTGFIKKGVTKLPSDGVSESFQCRYIRKTATSGVWDTGFHKFSPCYAGGSFSTSQKEIIVKDLKKNLVDPYEQELGEEGVLSHTNDAFWTTKSFNLYTGLPLNTGEPEDALTLYFALRTKLLTPKGQEGDTSYGQSSFIIVDINKDVKRKDEKASNEFNAIGIFEQLRTNDRERLISILNYIGLYVAEDIEDEAFKGIFNEHLKSGKGSINVDIFLSVYEETSEEVGRDKIEVFFRLKELFRRNNKVTKNSNGVYFYEDTEIGPDLKSAAYNIAKQATLKQIKSEILFSEDED